MPVAVDEHSWHLFILRIEPREFGGIPKALLLEALAAEGIPVSGGYETPAFAQPLFSDAKRAPHRRGACPVAERACEHEAIWVRHNALLGSREDTLDIVRALEKVQRESAALATLASRTS